MKSKPATVERLKEMVDLGLLKEGDIPKELTNQLAQQIADSVDEEYIKQIEKDIMGS